MTISAVAGTFKGWLTQSTSSTRSPRSRPANWYSDMVSGTGVTAAMVVPGSAPMTAAAGKGSRRSDFHRRCCWAPPRCLSQRMIVLSRSITCIR